MSDDGKKSKIFIKKKDLGLVEDKSDDFYEYDSQNLKSDIVNDSDYDYFDRLESVDYGKLRENKERALRKETDSDLIEGINEIREDFNETVEEKKEVEKNIFDESIFAENSVVEEKNNVEESANKKDVYETLFEDVKDYERVEPKKVVQNDERDDLSSTIIIGKINDRAEINRNEVVEDYDDDDYGSLDEDYTEKINYANTYATNNEEYEEDSEEDEEKVVKKSKKAKKKGKGWGKVFLKGLFFFFMSCGIIAIYFGLTHDLFKIDYIDIEGNIANPKEIVIQKSGVSVGDNIFLVSKSSIVNNLKTIPSIEEVKIIKDYPNILKIEIKEKYVSSFINNNSGITTIDNYGKVQEINAKVEARTGIQLKGITANGLTVGNDFTKDKAKKDMVLDTISRDFFLDIVSIDFSNDKDLIIELKNGLKVQFGDINDFSKKLDIISALLTKIKNEGINAVEIILNVGEDPIIVKK